jgi:predicted nuclease with TOPRIM domain
MSDVDTRLAELQRELEAGQRRLRELDAEREQVRDTLLRISGAIQVLSELRDEQQPDLAPPVVENGPSAS